MPWVRLDDDFYNHPKVIKAGPLGIAMQVAGLCYCNHYLTDGFIPSSIVPGLLNLDGIGMRMWSNEMIGGGEDAAWTMIVEDLINAGMWEKSDGGYRIHDYLEYQPSKEQVLAERDIIQTRKALHENPFLTHKIKARDKSHCRYCGKVVMWEDKKGVNGATYDHVIPDGGNSLENVVVSCRGCNAKKGRRTPEEAGMILLPPFQESKSDSNIIQTGFVNPNPVPNPVPNPKPKESGAKEPRQRDELFDAISKVCCVDPKVRGNGAKIGKARAALADSEPPYTADEVLAFGVWWNSDEWRRKKGPPTVWKLTEQVGIVRDGNGNKPHIESKIDRATAKTLELLKANTNGNS